MPEKLRHGLVGRRRLQIRRLFVYVCVGGGARGWKNGGKTLSVLSASFRCSQVKQLARCHSRVCLVKSCSTEITWGGAALTHLTSRSAARTAEPSSQKQQCSVLTTSGSNARSSANRRRLLISWLSGIRGFADNWGF